MTLRLSIFPSPPPPFQSSVSHLLWLAHVLLLSSPLPPIICHSMHPPFFKVCLVTCICVLHMYVNAPVCVGTRICVQVFATYSCYRVFKANPGLAEAANPASHLVRRIPCLLPLGTWNTGNFCSHPGIQTLGLPIVEQVL